jgi:hypothetical protein
MPKPQKLPTLNKAVFEVNGFFFYLKWATSGALAFLMTD